MEHYQREKKQEWSKKSKKYRTKYMDELKNLYGEAIRDKECQDKKDSIATCEFERQHNCGNGA